LKVGSLSAITANLGTITSGSISGTSLTVGSSPAVSGTSMTGAGAKINTDGTFALGNATTNISYNGSQMTLNGNVVATNNINSNAVTLTASAFTSADYRNTTTSTWQDAQTITITTNGSQVYVTSSGSPLSGIYNAGESGYGPVTPYFRLVRGSTELMYGGTNPAMGFSDQPTAGTYTYRLQVQSGFEYDIVQYAGLSNRSLFAIETKR
jgi:predicted RecA/RadA family phage recombinase